MEKTLKDRVAIVTGASSGIGEAAARTLAERGAAVVLAARDEEKLRALELKILGSGGHALGVKTDVADRASVEAMIGRTIAEFGMLDVLVNNAGVGLSGRVGELSVEDLRGVFEVNVIGAVNCIQAALPHLGAGSRIINVSSVVGKRSIPKVGGYCASKFALNALSDALRLEIADGVTVTSVYPGTTKTAFRDNSRRTRDEQRGGRPPGVGPEKVAEKIAKAAEHGGRDVYIRFSDRLFVAGTTLLPGITDRVLKTLLARS